MVTIIKSSIKNTHVIIELDNGEQLKIPVTVASLFTLDTGRSIDNTEYRQLKHESDRYQCGQKALDYLAIRARSAEEMRQYLLRKGYDKDIIRETINNLKESGYIDDFQFSLQYINDRMKRRLIGKGLIINELCNKGVSRSIASRAFKETEYENIEFEKIYAVAEKKYQQLKGKKNWMSRLSFFLHQRGFNYNHINKIIDRLRSQENKPDDKAI